MTLLAGAEPFRHDGGRTAALLCHGFTGSPQSMRTWAESLAQHGLAVHLPRLPGHGTRWQELNQTAWPDWYAELERAFGELRSRADTVVVMGLPMGGTLALRLAEERGAEVDGLVLVNPSVHSEDRRLRYLPDFRRVRPSIRAIGNDVRRPGSTELAHGRTPLRALDSVRELWRLTVADLDAVTQPVLLLRSAVDHVVEASNAARILRGISSTDVEEVVLASSYHVATLDHDDRTIFARSLAFSQRITSARTAG